MPKYKVKVKVKVEHSNIGPVIMKRAGIWAGKNNTRQKKKNQKNKRK